MNAVILHRIEPSHNLQRYYRLDVQPDLFGCWMFVREWGRIGSSGQMKKAVFNTLSEARVALERLRQVKEKRGYVDSERLMPLSQM